jgi:hypothetical protein
VAALTVQTPNVVGITPTYAAGSSGGDTFAALAGARYLLHMKNTSGGALTVTIDDPTSPVPAGTLAATFNPDITISVPATTGDKMMFLDASRFRDANGNWNITYSANPPTGLTLGVFGPF